MAEITAALVKELREKTGAGMMDAKNALVENKGDIEGSVDWLRKKGLAKAAKKSGRTAAEGLIALIAEGTKGAVVEVNSETDFVARNDQFQGFARKCASIVLSGADTAEKLAAAPYDGGKSVQETLTALIATIGENMTLRRAASLSVSKGVVSPYIHNAVADGLGKIGVLVALESEGDAGKLQELGRRIAMHIAAARPEYLDSSAVDPQALEREKNILRDQVKDSGKPPEIVEKMIEGRLRKFYEEVCLVDQIFVIDGESKISKVVEDAAKEIGKPVKLAAFVRFQLGEGIEKEATDFAAEVAAAVGG